MTHVQFNQISGDLTSIKWLLAMLIMWLVIIGLIVIFRD
jgi:hypothetical protein